MQKNKILTEKLINFRAASRHFVLKTFTDCVHTMKLISIHGYYTTTMGSHTLHSTTHRQMKAINKSCPMYYAQSKSRLPNSFENNLITCRYE